MKTSFLVMMLLVFSNGVSHAQVQVQGDPARALFSDFYTVTEPKKLTAEESSSESTLSSESVDIFWDQMNEAVEMGARVYSLLTFAHHNEAYGKVAEPYARLKHFGTWITPPGERCGNTRAEVLKRDSTVPTTNRPGGCSVATGSWEDPYTGRTFTSASDIQIDHFVPLKNAYISGADKWNKQKRCLYANYMGNEFHLLSVNGRENMKKSDRGPEGYMPPNKAYQCRYLAQWLKIKMIWSLGVTPPEKEAIETLAQENHCTAAELAYTQRDLDRQRRFIADNKDLCQ